MSFLSKIFGSKISLGIDLGSSSVKISVLEYKNNRWMLKNYGRARFKKEESPIAKKILELSDQQIADLIKVLLKKMNIHQKEFFASLPISAGFSTIITLPKMSESELSTAVRNEAEKYIPVSPDDVIIDWTVIPPEQNSNNQLFSKNKDNNTKIISIEKTENSSLGKEAVNNEEENEINTQDQQQILLVSVLKEIVGRYQNIFRLAGLEIIGWEEEFFSLGRSLIGNDKKTYLLINLGYSNISSFLINNGLIRFTYNFKARKMEDVNNGLRQIISLAKEKYHYQVNNVILTGGRLLSGVEWTKLLKVSFPGINFTIGDPLARVIVPPEKQDQIKNIAPLYAVAIGLAMKKEY